MIELRSWCKDTTKAIMYGEDLPKDKKHKQEERDIDGLIGLSTQGENVAQEKKQIHAFQEKHPAEVADVEHAFTDGALKEVFTKFDALFKAHPGLKKRAAQVMLKVLADEKKKGAFSRIDKLKDFQGITLKDRKEVAAVKKNLRGGFDITSIKKHSG